MRKEKTATKQAQPAQQKTAPHKTTQKQNITEWNGYPNAAMKRKIVAQPSTGFLNGRFYADKSPTEDTEDCLGRTST